jgi:hypothetical protein
MILVINYGELKGFIQEIVCQNLPKTGNSDYII